MGNGWTGARGGAGDRAGYLYDTKKMSDPGGAALALQLLDCQVEKSLP